MRMLIDDLVVVDRLEDKSVVPDRDELVRGLVSRGTILDQRQQVAFVESRKSGVENAHIRIHARQEQVLLALFLQVFRERCVEESVEALFVDDEFAGFFPCKRQNLFAFGPCDAWDASCELVLIRPVGHVGSESGAQMNDLDPPLAAKVQQVFNIVCKAWKVDLSIPAPEVALHVDE